MTESNKARYRLLAGKVEHHPTVFHATNDFGGFTDYAEILEHLRSMESLVTVTGIKQRSTKNIEIFLMELAVCILMHRDLWKSAHTAKQLCLSITMLGTFIPFGTMTAIQGSTISSDYQLVSARLKGCMDKRLMPRSGMTP
jgi:hypothetical protein